MDDVIIKPVQGAFAKNRAEELGYDVWEHFVVPPFYEKLDLISGKKPRVIIGGRGCGKTMLLRYLSHQSTFSVKRDHVPLSSLGHIGLYWRADTQFARIMTGRGLEPDTWSAAFEHLLAITFSLQVVKSIRGIAASRMEGSKDITLNSISMEKMIGYDRALEGGIDSIELVLEKKIQEFEMWVANTKKIGEPIFFPGIRFVKSLILVVREQIPLLSSAVFFAYIDEFENLHEYQKRIINTFVKHSEDPLILNIATKRNGMTTRQTVGDEFIMDIADYKTHDLEQYILEDGFEVFSAEVLSLTLAIANSEDGLDEVRRLRDLENLPERMNARPALLDKMRKIFPGSTQKELADSALSNSALEQRLQKLIDTALKRKRSSLKASQFIRKDFPEASIVCAALLNRSISPDEVLLNLESLASGMENKFNGASNWIHNNFVGCLLWLYDSYQRPCPFYAGFSSFCQLSHGNLRHFLELCNNSVKHSQQRGLSRLTPISLEHQAQAARQTSAAFLGEIKSFGRLGNMLHVFVLRLGGLLALAHRRPSQSEPEQCQFTVSGGQGALSEQQRDFLAEAVKWSVLFEGRETKVKDDIAQIDSEYVLNPIYAPYFQITYRKKRNLELKMDQFSTLVSGDLTGYRNLLRDFSKSWSIDIADEGPTIFTLLDIKS